MDQTLIFFLCFLAIIFFLLVPIYCACSSFDKIKYENLNEIQILNEE